MHRLLLAIALPLTLAAQYNANLRSIWIEPGGKERLPAFDLFDNALGKLGVIQASGPVDPAGHPFFTPLGTNGRACVNCHQPGWGMSVSAESLQDRWRSTSGKDPVFAAFDGSNCPALPQDLEKSHSLLLHRGLFRIRFRGRRAMPMVRRSRSNSPSK